MRKSPLLLLLAFATFPALAAPGDHARGARPHGDSQTEQVGVPTPASETRPDPATDRQQPLPEQQPLLNTRSERSQVIDPDSDRPQERIQRRLQDQRGDQQEQRFQRRSEQAQSRQPDRIERTREWRQRNDAGTVQSSWQPRERQIRTIPDTNAISGTSRGDRETSRHLSRRDYRDGNYTRWTNSWRDDRRYDWVNYRNHHRSIFRIGTYDDPFGRNYSRWTIGSFMYPSYYGANYWLNDPWEYRLPPAYGPYRWVRYWNDALLVNIYTGEVVDVLHNFFW